MTFDPLENVHFNSNLASSAGFDVFEMPHKKLENVFARVSFGAQIRVEMDGCKQMKVYDMVDTPALSAGALTS
jgi:hypothetical protein